MISITNYLAEKPCEEVENQNNNYNGNNNIGQNNSLWHNQNYKIVRVTI